MSYCSNKVKLWQKSHLWSHLEVVFDKHDMAAPHDLRHGDLMRLLCLENLLKHQQGKEPKCVSYQQQNKNSKRNTTER